MQILSQIPQHSIFFSFYSLIRHWGLSVIMYTISFIFGLVLVLFLCLKKLRSIHFLSNICLRFALTPIISKCKRTMGFVFTPIKLSFTMILKSYWPKIPSSFMIKIYWMFIPNLNSDTSTAPPLHSFSSPLYESSVFLLPTLWNCFVHFLTFIVGGKHILLFALKFNLFTCKCFSNIILLTLSFLFICNF